MEPLRPGLQKDWYPAEVIRHVLWDAHCLRYVTTPTRETGNNMFDKSVKNGGFNQLSIILVDTQ